MRNPPRRSRPSRSSRQKQPRGEVALSPQPPDGSWLQRRGLSLWIALSVALASLVLRLYGAGQWELCHYDEGVYVASGMRSAQDWWGFSRQQVLHSPPLYPWAIASAYRSVQIPWPGMGILVSTLCGAVTPVLLYWLLRPNFSRRAAAAAAVLLACSDTHIVFSGMALTDVPFACVFVAALIGAERLARPRPWAPALLFAAATLVAVGIKYNGWMPGAIALTAAGLARVLNFPPAVAGATGGDSSGNSPPGNAPSGYAPSGNATSGNAPSGIVRGAQRPGRGGKWLRVAGVAAGVVALAYLAGMPWRRYVDQVWDGGWAAVKSNHRGYFGELRQWPQRGRWLLVALPGFRHFGWIAGLVAGLAGTVYLSRLEWLRRGRAREDAGAAGTDGRTAGERTRLLLAAVLACLVAAWTGVDVLLLTMGAAAIIPAIASRQWTPLLAAVWLGAFLVLTPFYYPYVRLLVPALPPACALTVWLWNSAIAPAAAPPRAKIDRPSVAPLRILSHPMFWMSSGLLAAGLVAWESPFGLRPTPEAWRRSAASGYGAYGQLLRENTPLDSRLICIGQPVLLVYSPRASLLCDNEDFWPQLQAFGEGKETFLAVDFRSLYEPDTAARDCLRQHASELEVVGVIPFRPNLAMLLDHMSPWEVARKLAATPEKPPLWGAASGPRVVAPPDLVAHGEDVIVVYRVRE